MFLIEMSKRKFVCLFSKAQCNNPFYVAPMKIVQS